MNKSGNYEEGSRPLDLDIKSEIDVQVEPLDSCIKYTLEDENYDSVRNKNQISEHVEDSIPLNPHCIYLKTEDEVAEEEMDVCNGDLKMENVCDREMKIWDFENKFEEMKDGFSNAEEKNLENSSSSSLTFSMVKIENKNNGFEDDGNELTKDNGVEASCSQQEGQLDKKFRCSLCKYQTNRKDHFNGHLLVHSVAKLFKCPDCDYECNQKGNLKVHILTHSSIKLFKCFECNYECNEKGNLKKHLLTHSETKLFKCPECDYKCKRKSNLKHHLLTHSSKKLFKCLQCNYECNLKSNLKNHLLTHSNNKIFKCSECNYECNLKSNLQIHLLTHSNKKLFKCSKCDYECNVKSNLKVHVLTHSNTKLFKCPECDYEGNWKGNLKRHLLTHSNPIPF